MMDNACSNNANMKTVIITGGNSGLGYHCAKEIAATKAWQIILACRNEATGAEAAEKLRVDTSHQSIAVMQLDLASLQSVRQFVTDFLARGMPPLKALVCNAGLQQVRGVTYSEDGFETTFAVNHLGHFLLTHLLLEHVATPARIVFVSSGTHNPEQWTGLPAPRYRGAKALAWPEREPNQAAEKPGTAGRRTYATSKLCNVLCAYELIRRLAVSGRSSAPGSIAVNVFDPGLLPASGLARDYGPLARFAWYYILPVFHLFVPGVSSMRKSGKALARLVLDPELEGVSGKYFQIFKERPSSKESYDPQKAAELWETSVELVKLQPDESILVTAPS